MLRHRKEFYGHKGASMIVKSLIRVSHLVLGYKSIKITLGYRYIWPIWYGSLTWSRLRIQNFRKVFENKNGQAVTADVKNQIKIVTLTQLSCIHSNFEYQVSSCDTVKTQPHDSCDMSSTVLSAEIFRLVFDAFRLKSSGKNSLI